MSELIAVATQPAVLPLTFLVGGVVLFLMLLALGLMDIDFLDDIVDLELDGVLGGLLRLFKVGAVPLMIVFGLVITLTWAFVVLSVQGFGLTGWMVGGMYVPAFLLGLGLTKVIARPLSPLFRRFNDSHAAVERCEGQTALMLSDNDGTRISQAQIETNSSSVIIHVKARAGQHLFKGGKVLVIEEDLKEGIYYVEDIDL